ncbi:MAG: AcrB/AcrD/AcrF family protein, partial [Gammaproteobacteria bacterium]
MFNLLVEFSLRYKFLVLIGFGVVAFMGWRAVTTIPIDAFPDVTPIQVNIYTESPGLAAEDVEQLLTFPIESGLAGLPGVQEIRSVSLFGLSYVAVFFDDDMEIYFTRRLVMERLQEIAERIPEGYGTPEMGPNTSGLGQVFRYTLERADEKLNADISDMDLRSLQDWSVRLILRTAPGIDDVMSWGGKEKQYQVVIDPLHLIKYDVSFREIMELIESNNRLVGGQYIDIGREQLLVRGLGLVQNSIDIGDIVVKVNDGVPVYLRNLAKISPAPGLRFGAVTRDGKEVVLGMTLSRIGENAKTVVDAVKKKVSIVQASLPDGVTLRPVYERTELVEKAVLTAVTALVIGAVLVALVLYVFLGEFRSALVVIASLPLAMLIAFIFMNKAGLSANLMSLAGLAIGIGMVVDGAVVIVENSFRIMSERLAKGQDINRTSCVLAAAREVANPVAFSILIVIVVFLPLFSLEGLEGKLFKPMAFNISFAMGGSLLLALTLIPVLAAIILRPTTQSDTWLITTANRIYAPVLTWARVNRGKTISISVLILAVT